MATLNPEFPQPQMPVEEGPEDFEGLAVPEIDLMEPTDVEELPDGSAVVRLEDEVTPLESEFYDNLAEHINPRDLDSIALQYLDYVDKDRNAREERDKQYEEGLKRTGLGNDAPGGANFQGANKVVHPIMAESCVDFESRAIKELFPPDGPVRTSIMGDATEEKVQRAERKRDYMNWQLTEQIEEFRDEMEQMLTQLPLGGSQYIKLWYDEQKKRPCAEFVSIDNMIIPFSAANFYTAQRATEAQDITQMEFERRVRIGLYRDVDIVRASMEPEESKATKANNKIEGRKWDENIDGTRRVYHIYTWLELEEDSHSEGKLAPYILMIDELNSEVVGLYRNWEEGDETMAKLDWLVEFKFIPWRGAYAVGFPHLIGGLSAALTGTLRALLDTAHITNSATMLKLKGARISGQSQQVEITQVTEIEGAPGVDDVRKIAMPMPFSPPSPVLYQLLGWLTEAAKGVVTTSEEKIADVTSNAPVGTTQALIEQGASVFSAIHARLHASQARVLKILNRLNRWYFDDQLKTEAVKDLSIRREDFESATDVIPVSDPHIFSETQRTAQTQAVIALDKQYPGIMDPKAVVKRTLKQLKVPNIKELMPNAPEPTEINAAEENVNMSMGRPATAYPEQDHLAHLQVHLDYLKNPIFGSNPLIAPVFVPQSLEHIRHHMVMWYAQRMKEYASWQSKVQLSNYDDPKYTAEIDKLYSLASQHVDFDAQSTFQQIVPLLQQFFQMAQQMKQQPPADPADQLLFQASMAETQRRTQRDQADIALKAKQDQAENILRTREQQIQVALNAADNLTDERIKSAELTKDAAEFQAEQERTALTALQSAQKTLGGSQ